MDQKLRGKAGIVVGGTRGIGASISRRMIAEGASLVVLYASRTHEALALVDELKAAGGSITAMQTDAANPIAFAETLDGAIKVLGALDILVNVAGLAITGDLKSYSENAFDQVFALNVRAPFLAAQRVANIMNEGGRIISVGSIVADRMPGSGGSLYAASKSALGGLTRGLARDLGSRGITVNLVQPGPIDTDRNPADGPNAATNREPLAIQRHGRPDEVASLVAYLASDAAGFITGATYNIDGGWAA